MAPTDATQDELDNNQYTQQSILDYEKIYGEHFVSPGGAATARQLITRLSLPRGSRVLDAGCGIGGSAFLMAQEFGFQTEGIDLSENMVLMASEKLTTLGLADQIEIRTGDCLALSRPDYYDAIYSRDVFLHIANKSRLFKELYNSLNSGGKLLFTDYCCGMKPWQPEFDHYVQARGYSLHTLPEYAELVQSAGFDNVEWQDLTEQFIQILQSELVKIRTLKVDDEFVAKADTAWQEKLARAKAGDQRWGLVIAVKK